MSVLQYFTALLPHETRFSWWLWASQVVYWLAVTTFALVHFIFS
jgi:hypothetical protein